MKVINKVNTYEKHGSLHENGVKLAFNKKHVKQSSIQ